MIRLRLELDVVYNPDGTPESVLRAHLDAMVCAALNDGALTGDTPATVEEHCYRIVRWTKRRKK